MAADAVKASAPPPNPAVTDILDAHRERSTPAASTPVTPMHRPRGRPPEPASHLSMNPEAIRARRRRAKVKSLHSTGGVVDPAEPEPAPASPALPEPVTGPQLTPAALRELSDTAPASPAGPSIEEMHRAIKTTTMAIRAAGLLASVVLRNDDMKVSESDATETAELIVDAWPELASGAGGDAKKALAVAAVASLVIERVGKHRRQVGPPSLVPIVPATGAGSTLPMQPVSM